MKKSSIALLAIGLIVFMILAINVLDNLIESEEHVTPLDTPILPNRGYYMGIPPTPRTEQSFEAAYAEAALYAEFVPIWGKPSPFYVMSSDLSGE